MPLTLRNLEEDREDIGSRIGGTPDLEFLAAQTTPASRNRDVAA